MPNARTRGRETFFCSQRKASCKLATGAYSAKNGSAAYSDTTIAPREFFDHTMCLGVKAVSYTHLTLPTNREV